LTLERWAEFETVKAVAAVSVVAAAAAAQKSLRAEFAAT
jgi:hypothetical protein